jgi:hypothetical protein
MGGGARTRVRPSGEAGVYGRLVERNQLAELLDGPGYASSACRHALLDGARFLVWEGATPADRMVPAYERREALAAASGTATLGFPDALVALRAAGNQLLRLGQVTLANPPYRFMVFLSGDPDAVVACLGVQGEQK